MLRASSSKDQPGVSRSNALACAASRGGIPPRQGVQVFLDRFILPTAAASEWAVTQAVRIKWIPKRIVVRSVIPVRPVVPHEFRPKINVVRLHFWKAVVALSDFSL